MAAHNLIAIAYQHVLLLITRMTEYLLVSSATCNGRPTTIV